MEEEGKKPVALGRLTKYKYFSSNGDSEYTKIQSIPPEEGEWEDGRNKGRNTRGINRLLLEYHEIG